jgi:hypothetical protein
VQIGIRSLSYYNAAASLLSFRSPLVLGSIVDYLKSSFGYDSILNECIYYSSELCLTVLNIDPLS